MTPARPWWARSLKVAYSKGMATGARCPGTRGVEADEVALGDVDEVPDDVADLPVGAVGRRLPGAGRISQGEQVLGLGVDDAQQIFLSRIRSCVPHGFLRDDGSKEECA